MTKTGILLAGHGSYISPNTAGLVWACVDQIRQLGIVDEVSAAFWKEQPSFHEAIHSFTADDITVIPVFTTRGFFTQQVIPAEMGLQGKFTQRNGRTIRYTRTLSETPFLSEMTRHRVEETLQTYNLLPEQCAVAIIGHSTRRNPESRKATEAQAELIRSAGLAAQVIAVYLDDFPEIEEVYTLTNVPNLIGVPFFMAEGSHVIYDVRRKLGLTQEQTPQTIQNRTVYYTAPAGTDDGLVDALISLANEAATHFKSGIESNGFPAFGRDLLWEAVNRAPFQFGQLWLTPAQISFEESPSFIEDWTPESLRDMVRNRASHDEFRYHSSAKSLPASLPSLCTGDAESLHAAVETIYPGAVAAWAQAQTGNFCANSFDATIDRQVGQFRALANLPESTRTSFVQSICGKCTRHPTWHDGVIDTIPCREPCNLWLSAALTKKEN
jgi:sirohydrochlorin cobaltochelatase